MLHKNSSGEAVRRASPHNPLYCLSFHPVPSCPGIAKLCTFLDTSAKIAPICAVEDSAARGQVAAERATVNLHTSVLIATPVIAGGFSPLCGLEPLGD
jgi:hypothetical protein